MRAILQSTDHKVMPAWTFLSVQEWQRVKLRQHGLSKNQTEHADIHLKTILPYINSNYNN